VDAKPGNEVIHNPVLCLQTLCNLEDGLDDDGRKTSPELAFVDGEASTATEVGI
jgi:hypothetical protein